MANLPTFGLNGTSAAYGEVIGVANYEILHSYSHSRVAPGWMRLETRAARCATATDVHPAAGTTWQCAAGCGGTATVSTCCAGRAGLSGSGATTASTRSAAAAAAGATRNLDTKRHVHTGSLERNS